MKCLQCGTELDRLSKWRGSSEYCSEECKKKSTEEFNRLAMNRLMQPRPARTNARVAVGAIRTVDSAGGPLTMVNYPPGAKSPILTEPPEAEFIMDAVAVLGELQTRHQPPITPRAMIPTFPAAELGIGDTLRALEAILAGMRPLQRRAKAVGVQAKAWMVAPRSEPVPFQYPPCEPVWADSLGVAFVVFGIHNGPVAPFPGPLQTSAPIAHQSIPVRRGARVLAAAPLEPLRADHQLAVPTLSAPRLRIHLPKPMLQPLRPRYAFAPAPRSEEAVVAVPATVETAPVSIAGGKESEASAVALPVSIPQTPKSPEVRDRKASAREDRKSNEDRKPNKDAGKARPQKEERKVETVSPLEVKPDSAAVPKEAVPSPLLEKAVTSNPVEAKPEKRTVVPESRPEPEPSYSAPSFGGQAEEEPQGFFGRMPFWQKGAAAVVVLAAGVGFWVMPALSRSPVRTPSAAPALTSMGPESWETDSSGDTAGIARRRTISQYKPGRGKRDYSFEFTGQVEQRAMGWVFRMKDARNYYCLKLEVTGEDAAPTAQLVKFAVVNGEEQPHRLVSLREPLPAGQPVRVRLDVRGQNFSTQLNGKPVDVWIDNQLADGTVGFSNESGERAVIRSVKVTY